MSAPWDGKPLNSEQDGAHDLTVQKIRRTWVWAADAGRWITQAAGSISPDWLVGRATYHGPCLTPDAVAAAVQAERAAVLEILEAARNHNESFAKTWDSAGAKYGAEILQRLINDILARGDTSALAAAVEAARREEREACAVLVESGIEYEGAGLPSIQALEYVHQFSRNRLRRQLAAAIRARSGGKEGGVSETYTLMHIPVRLVETIQGIASGKLVAVPREPTPEMTDAAWGASIGPMIGEREMPRDFPTINTAIYRAMLAAAQPRPAASLDMDAAIAALPAREDGETSRGEESGNG